MKQRFSFKRKLETCGTADETDTDEKDDTFTDTKRKSRNLSEKKRRDQFNVLIGQLSTMVSATARKMDKSTVLKSAIAFLKNHNETSVHNREYSDEKWKPSFLSHEEFTHLMLEALDAFIIVFSVATGKIVYVSENITSLLGYSTNDINISVFELIHDSEKSNLCKLLQNKSFSGELNIPLHMKHGPIHFPNVIGFEAICLIGSFCNYSLTEPSLADCDSNSFCSSEGLSSECQTYFVALARFSTPQLLLEMTNLDGTKKEFVSKHSLEWKFLFLDHRAPPIIGYLPFEVLGTSVFEYYHVDDLEKVASSHEILMQTGEGTSCYYRFLTKGQQWIWLQTRCYITYHQWNSKPEFVVCTHTVFSYDQVESSLQSKSGRASNKDGKSKVGKKSRRVSPSVISSQHSDISSDDASTVHLPQLPKSVLMEEATNSCSLLMQDQMPTDVISVAPPIVTLDSPIMAVAVSEITNVAQPTVTSQIQLSNYQYLQWRHQQLQQQILLQQEELYRVSQQLLSVQLILPDMAPEALSLSTVPAFNPADQVGQDPQFQEQREHETFSGNL